MKDTIIYESNGYWLGFIRDNVLYNRDGIYLGYVTEERTLKFVWNRKGIYSGSVIKKGEHYYVFLNQLGIGAFPRESKVFKNLVFSLLPEPQPNIASIVIPLGYADSFSNPKPEQMTLSLF